MVIWEAARGLNRRGATLVPLQRLHQPGFLRGGFLLPAPHGGVLAVGEQEVGVAAALAHAPLLQHQDLVGRSEEHTSELQSLMRNSYAVFCLQKKNTPKSK